jgi:hypothetical protein
MNVEHDEKVIMSDSSHNDVNTPPSVVSSVVEVIKTDIDTTNAGNLQGGDRNPDGTFKKGVSGNPAGKKLGCLDFKTQFFDALEKMSQESGVESDIIYKEIFQQGILKARNGEYKFYRDLLDRLFGRALQPMDMTTGGKEIRTGTTFIVEDFSEEDPDEDFNGSKIEEINDEIQGS